MTRRKISFIGLEPEDALKQVAPQVEIKSQVDIFNPIGTELERDNSEAFRKDATC